MENRDDIQRVKDALPIEDIVEEYVRLEKTGRGFRANCPFHNEKTPSFYVTPSMGIYKCFGCGKSGDVLSFYQEVEGVEFGEALKDLARKAGVPLTFNQAQKHDNAHSDVSTTQKDRLYALMDFACRWYEVQLRTQEDVISHLEKERDCTRNTIKVFRIGFAPSEWSALSDKAKTYGYTEQELITAGLSIKRKDGSGVYDRFRSRILFPINDSRGRVVGFSGRIFGSDSDNKEVAKYVNSPETPLYNKSKVLFGFDRARNNLSKAGNVILVEGQFDLVLMHQVGFEQTIALSGTALSDVQAKRLSRLTSNVICMFDSDEAGYKAVLRNAISVLQHDITVDIVDLPEGSDPADLIQQDQKIEKLLNTKIDIFSFVIQKITSQYQDPHKRLKGFLKELTPLLQVISESKKAIVFSQLSQNLNIPVEVLQKDFTKNFRIQDKVVAPQLQPNNLKTSEAVNPHIVYKAYLKYFERLEMKKELDYLQSQAKKYEIQMSSISSGQHEEQQKEQEFLLEIQDTDDWDYEKIIERLIERMVLYDIQQNIKDTQARVQSEPQDESHVRKLSELLKKRDEMKKKFAQ